MSNFITPTFHPTDKLTKTLRFHARDHKEKVNSFAEIHTQTLLDVANEIERLKEKCDKQAKVIQAAFPMKSGHYFVCGEGGEKDKNGLPETILVCPRYGVSWFASYEKTEHCGGKG